MVFFTNTYGGTSLVRPLASRVFGDAHPSRHWDWSTGTTTLDGSLSGRCSARPLTAARPLRASACAACRRARQPGSPSRMLSSSARSSGRGLDPLAVEVLRGRPWPRAGLRHGAHRAGSGPGVGGRPRGGDRVVPAGVDAGRRERRRGRPASPVGGRGDPARRGGRAGAEHRDAGQPGGRLDEEFATVLLRHRRLPGGMSFGESCPHRPGWSSAIRAGGRPWPARATAQNASALTTSPPFRVLTAA